MKKLILLTGFIFTGISFAFSQTKVENAGPQLLNKLNTVCKLTPQQMAKLQPIVEKHVEALQTDKQKFSGNELKKADGTENMRFNNQLKGILSANQMKSYTNINK